MPEDILSLVPPPADARIAYGSDPNQFFDLRLPDKGKSGKSYPALINIHGGYWRAKYNLEHAGHLCGALTARGLATINLEYRRVGNDGGAWPETFADIRSGYRYMRQHAEQHHLDLRNLVVMGHSAGGQLALALAAYEPTVRSVVSLAGVVDLRRAYQLHLSHDAVVEFLRGTPDEVPDHYREADPMQLSIPRAQQWLICATEDEDVPPDLTRVYVAAKQKHSGAQKEDVHLIEIAGATHMDLIDPRSRAWKQVQATVLQLLA